ncbi:DUF1707 SHOCT-like domain-containing protein [Solirubrobacter soli]|uniref:DUF1707 SHOCT-like domain-containing protein n=1 Tax=Solirubrobacter soli TaxID=363832 RepID=UPI0004235B1D|nr:DUF1707 domain-containing protein [Solirubrobacter soli]
MDRIRASDSERERVVTILREAAIAGRLTVEELDSRCERAYAAVTRGELAALLEDLPAGASMKSRSAPPVPARAVSTAPSEDRWPGPSPWLVGDQRFYVQWQGPADPRQAGAQIIEHLVPMFLEFDYEIVDRSPDTLLLRRGLPSVAAMQTTPGVLPRAEVTIAMSDAGDHSVTEIYGVAPQPIREALARLAR